MDVNKLFEELYVKNAPSWSIERDLDGSYKYHATQSAFLLFEQQQIEIESLKVDLTKASTVPDGFVVVPKEPTDKQIQFVIDQMMLTGGLEMVGQIYKAMIEVQEPSHE